MPTFWQVFIINGCWILSKAFPPSIEMMIWFLFFSLLMWHITLICRHWSILSSLGWIPLAHCVWSFWCIVRFSLLYFGEDFLRLCSSMILAYFFFLVVSLSDFGIRVMVASLSLGVFLPLQFFGEDRYFRSFRRTGVNFSLNVWFREAVKS